jgi:hypothetical protein
LLLILLTAGMVGAQTPTQIKLILPGTASQIFAWDFNAIDEASIDSFVLQRTDFATTTLITSPYSNQLVISPKTLRSYTFTIPPTAALVGTKAFFRMVTRKVGLADSLPSNVVEVDVVATPPAPLNLRFP